jgi:hypothetical protein
MTPQDLSLPLPWGGREIALAFIIWLSSSLLSPILAEEILRLARLESLSLLISITYLFSFLPVLLFVFLATKSTFRSAMFLLGIKPDVSCGDIRYGIIWGFGIAFLGILLENLIGWVSGFDFHSNQIPAIKAILETEGLWEWVTLSLVIVLIAPLCEEVLFRGFLYPVFRAHVGVRRAILLNALLFSLLHFNAGLGLIGALYLCLPIFFIGVALAYLYEVRRNLVIPFTSHATSNLTSVAIILFFVA